VRNILWTMDARERLGDKRMARSLDGAGELRPDVTGDAPCGEAAHQRALSYRVSVRQDLRPAPFAGRRLKAYARAALALLSANGADVRVRVVGDAAIARWNREFLGRDRPTNVLSFPEEDGVLARGARVVGDIVVSAPTCLSETREWNVEPEARVFFFVLHGILHLAGYDHEKGGASARRMRRKELALFQRVLGEGRGRIR